MACELRSTSTFPRFARALRNKCRVSYEKIPSTRRRPRAAKRSANKNLTKLLTPLHIKNTIHDMKTYSSNQAAKKLGLGISTLSTYISVGKIEPPQSVTTGDITV